LCCNSNYCTTHTISNFYLDAQKQNEVVVAILITELLGTIADGVVRVCVHFV